MRALRLAFVAAASFAFPSGSAIGVGYDGDTDAPVERRDMATTRFLGEEVRFNLDVRHNDRQAVLLRFRGEEELVLNKPNLDQIKRRGQR